MKKWITSLLMPYIKEAYSKIRAEHVLARTNSPGQAFPSPPSSPTLSDRDTSRSSSTSDEVEVGAVQPIQRGHVTLLTQYCTREKKSIEWRFDKDEMNVVTPIWVAKALVNNIEIASGRGVTKKDAKESAAVKAVASLGLI